MPKKFNLIYLLIFVLSVFIGYNISAFGKKENRRVDQSFVVYHYTKGYLEFYNDNFDLASRDLWLVFPYIVDRTFYNELSDLLVYTGQYKQAEIVLKKSIKVYPKYKEFYYKLFDVYTIQGEKKEALIVLNLIKNQFKKYQGAIKRMALLYIRSRNYNKAYQILLKYVSKNPNDAGAQYYLSNVCLQLNKFNCALKYAKRAYEISKNGNYGLFLANLYEKEANFAKAIEIYNKLPKNSLTMYAIGDDYYLMGRLKDALKYYKKAFKLSGRVDYLEKIAFVELRLSRYDDIIKLAENNLDLVKLSDRLKFFYAMALENKGHFKKALNEFSKINSAVDFYYDVVFNKIYCYFYLNSFDKVEKLLDKKGDLKMYFAVVGELYLKKGKYKQAVKLLDEALKKAETDKQKADVYFYSADIEYNKLKDRDTAIKDLKMAIKLNPNFAEALNYLGYLYIDENLDVRDGMELVKKALRIKNNNPYYLDSLGWGYYKLKEYKKAEIYLTEALKLYKKNDIEAKVATWKHLMKLYEKTGRVKLSKEMAKKILKYKPNDKEAQKILKK